jgi:ribosomal protein S18 acetylase RimI-like enzyme
MIIRQFKKSDIQKVQSLIIEVWDELYLNYFSREDLNVKINKSYSDDALLSEFNKENMYNILVEDKGDIVGVCKSLYNPEKKLLSVGELYVSKKLRGKGLGLELLINPVKHFLPDKVELETHFKNINAQKFYQKHNFRVTGEIVKNWGRSSSTWYSMENINPLHLLSNNGDAEVAATD